MPDISKDPRFTKLPQKFIAEIACHEPTGIMGEDTWHEVQFQYGDIMCQCAVVNGEYVALPQSEIDQFTRILTIFPKIEEKVS